jgi:hypothetical protein
MNHVTQPGYAIVQALDILTAACRAEQLPVSAYGDIARLRLEYTARIGDQPLTTEDAAFHAFMAGAFPWLGPQGADWRNMREAFLAGRKSARPVEFEAAPI